MATAYDILQTAARQIGYASASGKVNPYNTAYYGYTCKGNAPAFCAAFVWWVFAQHKAQGLLLTKTAYVPTLLNAFIKANKIVTTPRAGDIVYFNWNGQRNGGPQHVGIVEKVISSSVVQTIEGNTSNSNQSNGGCVQRKQRNVKYIVAYSRPTYSSAPIEKPPTQQAQAVKEQRTVTSTNGLNVRSGPGTNYAVCAPLLKNGTKVTVTKETNGWGFIGKGWISLMYTKAVQTNPSKAWTVKVNSKSGLNIRKKPNTSAGIAGVLTDGTSVSVNADNNGWLTLTNGKGYISKQFTKKA